LARYTIIHDHHDKLLLDRIKDTDLIKTARIVFPSNEHSSNGIGKFGRACECGDEPTVTHGALAYIVGFYFAFEKLGSFAAKGPEFVGSNPIRFPLH
jgi:hypothetical protein